MSISFVFKNTMQVLVRYLLLIISFSATIIVKAQVLYPESELVDYYRLIEIKNSNVENRLNIFPSIVHAYNKDSLAWDLWKENIHTESKEKNEAFNLLPIRWSNGYNSAYARGYNDGAVWKGKGLTSSLQGGVNGSLGLIQYTFAPIVFYSQNTAFDLAPTIGNNNPFNYQFRNNRIDHVQRYGNDAFTEFDFGQSEVRLVYKSFTLGISTQNIVFGHSQENPLIISNNAAGIPHVDVGTYKPVATKIGSFEGKIYYGMLRQSDYFNSPDNDGRRFWSGLSVGYNPSFLPDLTLGFNRSFYKNLDDFTATDLFIFIDQFDDTDGNRATNDDFDQMGSVTMRWLFRDAGFEMYAEYGKNDFGGKFWGTSPEHARAYTIGFSKYVDVIKDNVLKLTYEHTSLDKPRNSTYRGYNSWYSHGIVRQGYTLNGQLIGGGIGSGSVSDFFEAQYFFPKGRWSLRAKRIRFDDDYFFDEVLDINRHDHEWTFESRLSKFVKSYLISFDLAVSLRQNQYFIESSDQTNLYLGLGVFKTLKK